MVVGGTGRGAVVIAVVIPCVAAKTAATTMSAISSGGAVPGMGATGGRTGAGSLVVPWGMV